MGKLKFSSMIVLLLLICSVSHAQYFDKRGKFLSDVKSPIDTRIGWTPVSSKTDSSLAIGVLTSMPDRDGYFCSASLIAMSNQMSAPVYILTAGHCLFTERFLQSPRLVIKDEPFATLDFYLSHPLIDVLASSQVSLRPLQTKYATMDGVDIAILETGLSVAESEKLGLKTFKLSSLPLRRGQAVYTLGTPLQKMPKESVYTYRSDCTLGRNVRTIEGPFKSNEVWTNNCSLITGLSGSPVVDLNSREIIGLQITGIDPTIKNKDCDLDQPCEISVDGSISMHRDVSYAHSIINIAKCFDPFGSFNPSLRACRLSRW